MIDGSCYREVRNWKIFVIFGWHCFCSLFYIPLLFTFPSISLPPRGKCWKGKLQKNQKKQKNKTLKTWKIGEAVSFPFRASDPAFLACPFSFFLSYSLFSFIQLITLFCILFFWSLHLSMSYDSIFPFFSAFLSISISISRVIFFSSSLHRSTRAQRVSFGLLVYVILFFNWEFQWTWSYILISSK